MLSRGQIGWLSWLVQEFAMFAFIDAMRMFGRFYSGTDTFAVLVAEDVCYSVQFVDGVVKCAVYVDDKFVCGEK
jgi:hypothetical protein